MKERPILFSGPMVRAILSGRKTRTRRVVKTVKSLPDGRGWDCVRNLRTGGCVPFVGDELQWKPHGGAQWEVYPHVAQCCPYGQPGDRLWVRESFYQLGHWEPVPGVRTKGGRQKWRFVAQGEVQFDAPDAELRFGRHHKDPETVAWHKRLARFMPRKASRITLEIVSVRVERLQEISEADAMAEGIDAFQRGEEPKVYRDYSQRTEHYGLSAVGSYRTLWESINDAGSWDANPWVWVVEFKRL